MMTFAPNASGNRLANALPVLLLLALPLLAAAKSAPVVLPGTGQDRCYDASTAMPCPGPGQAFHGQDAQQGRPAPAYRDNGDGTVTDLATGLMWSQGLDGRKLGPEEAARAAARLTLGGHSDWRIPNIKELYSLIDFRGYTGVGRSQDDSGVPANAIPFINTDYFAFAYGDKAAGERFIDAQWLSATRSVSPTMNGMETVFGVNFADGRIKGYGFRPQGGSHTLKTFFVRYVRGPAYGRNLIQDNRDGTLSDLATGLMWTCADSHRALSWQAALSYCNGLEFAGHADWRLPDAKELQYLADYRRSPDATGSAAIDPLFQSSVINNEASQQDYPYYWTSTTHLDGPRPGMQAVYVAFGRAVGAMHGQVMDVHGAGAQRSDPKTGEPAIGRGPQGDAQRINNYARCVRGGLAPGVPASAAFRPGGFPQKIRLAKVRVSNVTPMPQAGRQGVGQGAGMEQGAVPPTGGGFVNRLDRDADKRVSRKEFDGPPEHFDLFDRDRNGYLTESEAPPFPPPPRF